MPMPAVASDFSPLLRDAARGLAQQMVFWGQDVRHGSSNLLLRFGMERRPSAGLTGTSCYSMAWDGGLIELHGAVASWTAGKGGVGCVFCRDRERIDLWLGEKPPIPGRESGEFGDAETRWEAFRHFLSWLCRYEDWVEEMAGDGWREAGFRALKKLPKGKPWLAPEFARAWWTRALEGTVPRAKHFSI
ncbi:MAG: hypothetical protein QM627_06195 [Luteolibacter sp.]